MPNQFGPPQTPPVPAKRSIFRRWWFWLIIVIVLGIVAAVATRGDEDKTSADGKGTTPTSQGTADKAGSRDNPLPIGSTISGPEFDVTVNSVTLGANEEVLAANMFNEAPPEGSSYAVVNLTLTYKGNESGLVAEVSVAYVTSTGEVDTDFDHFAVAPEPALNSLGELYKGGTASGNTVVVVPDGDSGTIRIRPGMLADEVFVAIS
jgi:hypothetical protein